MKIGLPRALLFYRCRYLWQAFFEELGHSVVLSSDTDINILNEGKYYSIDESCLPFKIFTGHVYSLIGRCDCILIPRIDNYGRKSSVCVKFNALYDIINNTFEHINLLGYNVDCEHGHTEKDGFITMGLQLGTDRRRALSAYNNAFKYQQFWDNQNTVMQNSKFHIAENKILLVSHDYNIFDKVIGEPIIRLIRENDGTPIYSSYAPRDECLKLADESAASLYWLFNRELIGAVKYYYPYVDGIILLTAFPCGPDSLVNELIIRKFHDLPIINIILDELTGDTGLATRIESFMDIIKNRKELTTVIR